MKGLYADAAARASRYLDGLDERRVFPDEEAIAALDGLGGPLPEEPAEPAAVLARLDGLGSPATVASAGRRYFGFVTGGTLPAALAAHWLAGAWDQNAAFVVGSPVAARLEEIALGWIRALLSLGPEWGGGFVTGTTMASFCGLAAARGALLRRAGWDVEARGLFGAPELRVVVGEEAHATLFKALGLLGLGRERVLVVPTDEQGRLRAEALPPLDERTIVCLQAGNVATGAFDPIAAVVDAAERAGAWVHLDGAFGLWARLLPDKAALTEGLERVDSIATDLHKWINVPYDSGLALYRDPSAARAALALRAAYLPEGGAREPYDFTPEASRRARGVEIWAAIASLGRRGLVDLVARCCRHARRFAAGFRAAGLDVPHEVVLNQVLVRFGDDGATRRVVDAVQREGTCWCGTTVWKGRTAMRVSVSSWATREEDVERSLEAILAAADAGV